METVFHGAAFGLSGAVASSVFNDHVFKESPGFPKGMKWAAYSSLTGLAMSLVVDGILPFLVFASASMPILWVGGSFLAAVLFFFLRGVSVKITAMLLFGGTAITNSTHNLFSLLAAAAYVAPKFRGTSFAIRATCAYIGLSAGAFAGGALAQISGFDSVMLFCSVAIALAGIAAGFAGTADKQEIDGAAVNANDLIKYSISKNK